MLNVDPFHVRVEEPPTVFVAVEYKIWPEVVVAGYVAVDHDGAPDAPDCSIWFAVAVPASTANADAPE